LTMNVINDAFEGLFLLVIVVHIQVDIFLVCLNSQASDPSLFK